MDLHIQMSWFFPFETIDGEEKLWGEICYSAAGTVPPVELDPADVLTLDEARASWPEDWL